MNREVQRIKASTLLRSRSNRTVGPPPPGNAPPAPVKGLRFWVQTGTHYSIGQGYAIGPVNSRSFYVASAGGTQRHNLLDWTRWLLERCAEGKVILDGHPMRPPAPAGLAAGIGAPVAAPPASALAPRRGGAGKKGTAMDVDQRDARVLRAVRDVLRSYRIDPARPSGTGLLFFSVHGGAKRYVVSVDPQWRFPPCCTCPDTERVKDAHGATFCKHVIAVLLSHAEHRHQLIDLLL